MGDCSPEGFLITDFEGNLIEGTGKPTREALLHGYIYKLRPDIQAVVHVHSPYAIGWSSSKKGSSTCNMAFKTEKSGGISYIGCTCCNGTSAGCAYGGKNV